MPKLTQEEIEQLMGRALDLLAEEDDEEALSIAAQLMEAEVPEGFSLAASVNESLQQGDEAKAILISGIAKFPDHWEFYVPLAELESQSGNTEQALAYLDKAESLPDNMPDYVNLHRAVAYSRVGEFEKALELLEQVEDMELVVPAINLQVKVLYDMGRLDLIIELANEKEELIAMAENESETFALGEIHTLIADAYFQEDEDEESATEHIYIALEFDRTQIDALDLLRRIKNMTSEKAKPFSLLVSGRFAEGILEEGEDPNFITSYVVMAESPEEALELVRDFETDDIDGESLRILEVSEEELDDEDDKLKGVVMASELGMLSIEE